MTVKYHIETLFGIVTRTTRGVKEARYSHIVIYNGRADGVPGRDNGWKGPTFHGSRSLADAAGQNHIHKGRGAAYVHPITETDYTIT